MTVISWNAPTSHSRLTQKYGPLFRPPYVLCSNTIARGYLKASCPDREAVPSRLVSSLSTDANRHNKLHCVPDRNRISPSKRPLANAPEAEVRSQPV